MTAGRRSSAVPVSRAALAALLVLAAVPGLAAQPRPQRDPLSRAFELERRGATAGAAEAYLEALTARPSDLAALLGLERALVALGRPADVLPSLRATLGANPASGPAWGVGIRVHVILGQSDSARAALEHWAALAPESEEPWRELGRALAARRDRATARRTYEAGRERLGRPDALAADLAELLTVEGRYPEAAREWVLAMRSHDGYRHTTLTALAPALPGQRNGILETLRQGGSDAAAAAAALAARWGDPVGGFRMLEATLPPEAPKAATLLREFIEQLTPPESPAAHHAHAAALESLAARAGAAQAPRLRSDAARAYAAAGRAEDARRMLGALAADGTAPTTLQAGAAVTLVELLVEEGKLDEAGARLSEAADGIAAADRAGLRRRIALGWARHGDIDRAERLAGVDSTVDGLALRGRLRLFRGDVAGARAALQAAGPFAGGREEAADRVALLALLAPVEVEQLPALGAALLAAERGDTAAAVAGLERTAAEVGAERGGAGLLVLAGRMEVARGRDAEAERLLGAARAAPGSAAAPSALLELARLAIARGRPAEAIPHLEALILEHPKSALVPQARRLLDEARGAVPRS
jgi:tetratricopeptide (TPR) repeat protein